MPLDTHGYLVAQGWQGKGVALRDGAISRPLAIPQKRTLAGVGKDRDEAFPFWDHLFTAASKAIQIKVSSEEDSLASTSSTIELQRTKTGIISNRRPIEGTRATSRDENPRTYSLISEAKRHAARQSLYAMFFRGPVLKSDEAAVEMALCEQSNSADTKKRKHVSEDRGNMVPVVSTPLLLDSELSKEERKRIKREAKDVKRKAKLLAMAWIQNSSTPDVSHESQPRRKKRKEA